MDTTTFIELLLSSQSKEQKGKELTGSEWGTILQHLITLEIAEGGPYAIPISEQKELSATEIQERNYVLNSKISEFFAMHEITLPHVEAFLAEKDHKEAVMLARIRRLSAFRLKKLPKEMQEKGSFVIERTIAGNPDRQMPLMPYYLRKALGTKGAEFSDELIAELGLANVYFWTAFILYDDLWDNDEAGDPHLLPIANLFARHFIDTFSNIFPSAEKAKSTTFRDFFHRAMDDLDAANNWETTYCRMRVEDSILYLPEQAPSFADYTGTEYEQKYQPVAGHIMGPVAMVLMLGYSLESHEVQSLIRYFKNYLIAMQLNDDLHDWKEDLHRGHITTATIEMLRTWKEKYPDSTHIHLERDIAELEELFWFEILEPLCEKILSLAHESRKALSQLTFLEDLEPLEKFIIKNEEAAHKALSERKWSEEFLRSVVIG